MPVRAVLDLGSMLPEQQWFYDMAVTSFLLGSAQWDAWLADAEHSAFRVITPHCIYTVRREQRFGQWRWSAYPKSAGTSRLRVVIGTTSDLTALRLRDIGRVFGTEQEL